jgi:hypothetical protein
MSANLIVGKDPDGNKVPVAVDATGQLKIVGGGGGGGSTDMTTANAQLTAINSNTDGLEGKADTGNALLTTTAADTAIIKDEAILIDGKLPALSSGRIPVEAANTDSQEFTFNQTGAIAVNTTLIQIDAQKFREVVVFPSSIGTNGAIGGMISFNGTTWYGIQSVFLGSTSGNVSNIATGSAPSIYNTYGARFFRLAMTVGATSGTTTISAWASQTVTPKLYQSVSGSVTVTTGVMSPLAASNTGFNTYHTLISAASTNATSVKASGGTIGSLLLTNNSTSLKWFRIFNSIVAPTVGTSTPVWNISIQPNSTLDVSTAFAGFRLANGIAYAITGGAATAAVTDAVAVSAGDVVVNMTFA